MTILSAVHTNYISNTTTIVIVCVIVVVIVVVVDHGVHIFAVNLSVKLERRAHRVVLDVYYTRAQLFHKTKLTVGHCVRRVPVVTFITWHIFC